MQHKKNKRTAIINPLKKSNDTNKSDSNGKNVNNSKQSIMGVSESWWDEMTKKEESIVNDYKRKCDNINLMQQYETKKDPSPFNTDNDMNLSRDWDDYLWKESQQKQEEYLKKIDAAQTKKNKKKKKKKKSQSNGYGNLVGFFNKSNTKKSNKASSSISNPYLDPEVMKGFGDFTPDKNQSFEKKFDLNNKTNKNQQPQSIQPTLIQPTIIGSDEFIKMAKPISINENKQNTKDIMEKPKMAKKQKIIPAFNGQVFERKPPDIVYANEDKNKSQDTMPKKQSLFKSRLNPQPAPIISQPKSSLFRKRIERNDAMYQIDQDEDIDCKKEDICLLFLDVDGVLNCRYSPSLSKPHIMRLKKILNRTKSCKICISSTWRVHQSTRQTLMEGLKKFGDIDVDNIVIGDTPQLPKDPMKFRSEEINIYLNRNKYLNKHYNVLSWCVIDDVPLNKVNEEFNDFIKDNFVKTDPSKGITDIDVERVICILNNIDKETTTERVNEIIKRNEKKTMAVVKRKTKKPKMKEKEKEKLKLLFLDVDGVLNYRGFDDDGVNGKLSVVHLKRLKKIVDDTKCRIVLSTSWRRIPNAKKQLLHQLSSIVGIDKIIIGSTPILGSEMKKSMEIYQYLKSIENNYDIISWIAIDDMPLDKIGTKQTKEMMKGHLIKTEIEYGLNDNDVKTAISILNAI